LRPSHLLLAVVVLVAAAGRFADLGWGLRHVPEIEERLFVENVRQMAARGDLDHRFYEYPGLLFYLMAPAVAVAEGGQPSSHPAQDEVAGPRTYLAARGVIAAGGVISVLLVFFLGRRLIDERGGLVAAALLAVSPFEIETAHTVRPDVVLETFVILALLAFLAVGGRLRADARAGAALGAAAAVKFTGGLLVPVYLLARAWASGPRVKGTLLAGVVSALTWVAFTPYALLRPAAFFSGTAVQVGYHYRSGRVAPRFLEILVYYLRHHAHGLGALGVVLALAGLALALRRPRREWMVVVAWPVVLLAVLCTADMRYGRLALSASCVAVVLAARALVEATRGRAALTAVATLVVAALPAWTAVRSVRALAGPLPDDVASDWIAAHVPQRAVLLCRLEWLDVDRARFEVLRSEGAPAKDAMVAPYVDYVVDSARDPLFGELAPPVFTTEGTSLFSGERIAVRPVPAARRSTPAAVTLAGVRVSASSNEAEAAAAVDGQIDTAWTSTSAQAPGDWLELELPEPHDLVRIELLTGGKSHRAAQQLVLRARDESGVWRSVPFVHARAPVADQPARGRSQVLVFAPMRTQALRFEQAGRAQTRWSVAEIRLGEEAPGP
jgi:4-amino-4-deoxy-L-arabinose transferase-like glycosyltransferase